MAKKVGVITFHRAINYGAVLQAYGLCTALKMLDADPELIDYRNEHIENLYRLDWGLKKSYTGVKSWLPTVPLRQAKTDRFRRFVSSEIKLSKACDSSTVSGVASKYDAVITGSDQVFNPKLSGMDKAYFCDFAGESTACYSYAASLGDYQFEEERDFEYLDLMNRFEEISVRESSSKTQLDGLTRPPVRIDIDPTMLLSAVEWNKLLPSERIRENPYIFVYSVHPLKTGLSVAKELASETDKEVVFLHNRIKDARALDNDGVVLLHDSSPYDWLRLIRDADCVITNSFHGTVFSIIFNSLFLSEVDTRGGFNNRIWRLLSDTGLTTRLLERCNLDSVEVAEAALSEVDWSKPMSYLAEQRESSLAYLARICA